MSSFERLLAPDSTEGPSVGAGKRCKLSASTRYQIEPMRKSAFTNAQHANMKCGSRFGPVTYWLEAFAALCGLSALAPAA